MEDLKNKKSIFKKWWFWVIAILILFMLLGSGSSNKNTNNAQPSQNNTAQEEQYIKITASELLSEYKANQVAADDKYKNKIIEVSGTINSIGKDVLDTPYVTIGGSSDIFTNIQCMFAKGDQSQLINLQKDTKITLRGNVSGYMMNVLLTNCSLVK
jgi:hypothetical protein